MHWRHLFVHSSCDIKLLYTSIYHDTLYKANDYYWTEKLIN